MTPGNVAQFSILAGCFEFESLDASLSDAERSMAKRHARELRELLSHAETEPPEAADTEPDGEPDGEPAQRPAQSMRWPSEIPTGITEDS